MYEYDNRQLIFGTVTSFVVFIISFQSYKSFILFYFIAGSFSLIFPETDVLFNILQNNIFMLNSVTERVHFFLFVFSQYESTSILYRKESQVGKEINH